MGRASRAWRRFLRYDISHWGSLIFFVHAFIFRGIVSLRARFLKSKTSMGDEGQASGGAGIVEDAQFEGTTTADSKPGDGDRVAELEEAFTAERGRNKRLQAEIKHLHGDMDQLEGKLKLSEEDVDELLFERKKLQLKLDSYVFKKKDFEKVQKEVGELRIKVSEQEQTIDDQKKHLEDQDCLIQSLEKELNEKKDQSEEIPSTRISDGRKKYHDSQMEMKEKAISKLKNAVDLLMEKQASEKESVKLAAANHKIEILESKLEDLQLEFEAMKHTSKKENQIQAKSKLSALEWRYRAEAAERKLAELGKGSSRKDHNNDDFMVGESDQGLLLQGVLDKKKNTKNGWRLGGLFVGGDGASTSH